MRPCHFLNPVPLTDDMEKAMCFDGKAACHVYAEVLNKLAAGSDYNCEGPFIAISNGRDWIIKYQDRDGWFVARD